MVKITASFRLTTGRKIKIRYKGTVVWFQILSKVEVSLPLERANDGFISGFVQIVAFVIGTMV